MDVRAFIAAVLLAAAPGCTDVTPYPIHDAGCTDDAGCEDAPAEDASPEDAASEAGGDP
ncbi:MAG: hypothetical protein HYV09_08275 [Deltaproteobacteria bacterium]|nr:hypothetical protein [Deltaproteobacteria bacterium]